MRLSLLILGVVCSWALNGCGEESSKAASTEAKPVTQAPQTDRERQINNTQAASAVGYDGDALKSSVQKTVNTLENHTSETSAATTSATGTASPSEPDASK